MSEDNKTPAPEAAIAFTSAGDRLVITFSDGDHEIPQDIIDVLGRELLVERAPRLREISWDRFVGGVMQTIQRQNLRQFHADFVAGHFGRVR